MKNRLLLPVLIVAISVVGVATAKAQGYLVDRQAAKRFATMPQDGPFPEGITANPANGDIYVSTFNGTASKIFRFNKNGRFLAKTDALNAPILGMAFGPDGKVYYCNVGNFVGADSKIQRIDADLDGGTIQDVAIVPSISAPPDLVITNPDTSEDIVDFGGFAAVPNDLTINNAGDQLFFSDSFQGAVFRIDDPTTCGTPCAVVTVAHDGLLATVGIPPFGANGVALNNAEDVLFVANTGDDRILSLPIDGNGDAAGALTSFAESINGADGIAFDADGRLWVAANQADEMVALNGDGKVIAKLGDFLGIRKDGAVNGLIFPASQVIHDGQIFVTNLALFLNGVVGDEIEEDVSTYTVSRIQIPNFNGAETSAAAKAK